MKIIAHIGQGKTGTSSIQRSLAESQGALNTVGAHYVGLNFELSPVQLFAWQYAGGWPELVQNGPAVAQQQLAEVLTKTIKALENEGIRQLIWSNESILPRCNIVSPILQSIRSPLHPVEIILYVRRHDAWARSAFVQWGIKHKAYQGKVKSFAQWLERRPFNFSKPIKLWLDLQWDSFHIRNFDACEDVVRDFLHCCAIADGSITSCRDNETPEAVALALWAMFNSQTEGPILPSELQPLLRRTGVLNKKYQHLDLFDLFPKPDDMAQVMEAVQKDMAEVNKILGAFGQPPLDSKPLKEKVYDVSYEQLFTALLDMVKFQDAENTRQDGEIQNLKSSLAQLEQKLAKLESKGR